MPKQKTNKSVLKRFKLTGSGKVKRPKCGKRHLNSHKTGQHKRRLRGTAVLPAKVAEKYILAMGGL
jgi:large subunit ribosomal protein L35